MAARSPPLAAQYTPIMTLASGGMASVELALRREGEFRRLYAVKRIHRQFKDDESFRSMFLDEARIAGLLRHPNVVSVLDVGEDDEGPYLVMDYVDGVPASTMLRLLRRRGGRLPVQLAVDIAAQTARGLHAAHELCGHDGRPLRLVHRDVSPQNLLVGFDGVVRVTDFGVAKALGRTTKTDSGVLKGKLGYMCPEQLRFEEPDRRSDLFALGIVLYELLAGSRLYVASETASAPKQILNEPVPDVGEARRDLPPALVELSFDLLAKRPELRPATAAEVVSRLEAIRDELLAEEGRISLEAYVTEHFGDLRDARSSKVEAALSGLEEESAEPAVVVPQPRRRWWVGAGMLAAGGLGAALVLALSGGTGGAGGADAPPASPDPAGAPPEHPPSALAPAAAAETPPDGGGKGAATDAAGPERTMARQAEDGGAGEQAGEARPSAARRATREQARRAAERERRAQRRRLERRRQQRSRQASTHESSDRPIWEWE